MATGIANKPSIIVSLVLKYINMEKKQTHLTWGIITSLVMIVLSLIMMITEIGLKYRVVGWLSMAPVLVGLILNANAYSKANNGFVTYGNVFASCFKASLIVAVFMVAWSVVTIIAFPELKEKTIEMTRQKMATDPRMTEDSINMALDITRKYWNLFAIGGAVIVWPIVGAVCSLIAAAVPPKKGEQIFVSPADNF